ncbi:S66 family peptidase [Flexilinea flocculi]|jgi:muramoyltetrapeptide carboxypeptidase LdcA involved in peptidoglycan recycling|uniref:Muramoyltetrapeptide carboxypeptidase LdcA n=1 Tax=Flexilinea flocculi TaxID=1678840 RepID=A0A0K8PB28_9CHLR|nr:S66 peptidase family protein [Flexilinea flocculi]NMB94346.1 LD-carboxypeptidase [Flexilinea flocculi]GAP39355.1 muramoyltetrapeptide carboxypeptidase LdcA [Flexilinea flocculi]
MLLAPKLKTGDTIAVFSPSSPVTCTAVRRYQRGKSFLESKGFRVKEGALTGKRDYYRSGSIQERVDELNQLIQDPEVQCIMSSIGGWNSNSLLPYIDYKSLQDNPKIIVGYSDVTALLLGIYAQTGLICFYGPAMAASLGELPPLVDDTWTYFKNIVAGNMPIPYILPTPDDWTDEFIDWETQNRKKNVLSNQLITIHPGIAEGRIIGGNLNTMQGIWGSPFMPKIQTGDILFLEDSLLDAAIVERSFSLLKINGIFDRIGGLILGKHELFKDCGSGRKPYDILLEIMGQTSFPVLAQFDCCHTHPMLTLPIGCKVRLDAYKQTVTLLESPVFSYQS